MISHIPCAEIVILAFAFLDAMTNYVTVGTIIMLALFYYYISLPRNIYLVDFACYKPDASLMVSRDQVMKIFRRDLGDEAGNFLQKVLYKSGLGDKTYIPESLRQFPPKSHDNESWDELKMVMFGVIDALLEKDHVQARDIGVVIVNSSTCCPMPSPSDTIVNHYKFNEDVLNYDLAGMGCSASLSSIQLAKQILQGPFSYIYTITGTIPATLPLRGPNCTSAQLTGTISTINSIRPNTYALVVSVESVTQSSHAGNTNKSMLISNCLFRMGGAAMLLSNISSDRPRSKYQLMHVVRTHRGRDNRSYNCVFEDNDDKGCNGMSLSKDLMEVAGQALKSNIMTLGPLVLPISEQFKYLVNFVQKNVLKTKMKSYVPNFKRAFDHFCVHAGGKGVLDAVEGQLGLSKWDIEPSRMTLYRFGNTTSSSVWYVFAYCEAKGRIKKNDRIWQVAFGSGFKCTSVVWKALTGGCAPAIGRNPWMDEIDDFPTQAIN